MTIRLPDDQADELELIARTLEAPLAEIIRQALTGYITATRSSSEFTQKLRERIKAEQAITARYIAPRDK